MSSRPTVIVLATDLDKRPAGGLADEGHGLDVNTAFALTLHHVLASLLPMVVVATPAFASLACSSVAARDVVVVESDDAARLSGRGNRNAGNAIATGVWARPDSAGWLAVPAHLSMLRPSTMRAVAAALAHHTVAYAQHLGRAGHPIGFAAELYSELVTDDDDGLARRMMARYPSHAVEVDDAGAVLDFSSKRDLAILRAAHAEHQALRLRPT